MGFTRWRPNIDDIFHTGEDPYKRISSFHANMGFIRMNQRPAQQSTFYVFIGIMVPLGSPSYHTINIWLYQRVAEYLLHNMCKLILGDVQFNKIINDK